MYKIPYILHKQKMYKAYIRERNLKTMLIASNGLWAIVVAVLLMR